MPTKISDFTKSVVVKMARGRTALYPSEVTSFTSNDVDEIWTDTTGVVAVLNGFEHFIPIGAIAEIRMEPLPGQSTVDPAPNHNPDPDIATDKTVKAKRKPGRPRRSQ